MRFQCIEQCLEQELVGLTCQALDTVFILY